VSQSGKFESNFISQARWSVAQYFDGQIDGAIAFSLERRHYR